MMKGVCVEKGSSWHLQEGKEYFLGEYGPNHFSASKFDKPKSYFGIFQKDHFKLIEIEQEQQKQSESTEPAFDSEYKLARIITRDKGMYYAGVGNESVWVVKEHRSWGYAAYYPDSMKLKGIWKRERLKVIGTYDPIKVYEKTEQSVQALQKQELKPVVTENPVCEQLSLFSF